MNPKQKNQKAEGTICMSLVQIIETRHLVKLYTLMIPYGSLFSICTCVAIVHYSYTLINSSVVGHRKNVQAQISEFLFLAPPVKGAKIADSGNDLCQVEQTAVCQRCISNQRTFMVLLETDAKPSNLFRELDRHSTSRKQRFGESI